MKRTVIVCLIGVLSSIGVSSHLHAMSHAQAQTHSFSISSEFGARNAFEIDGGRSGCLFASIDGWTGRGSGEATQELAIILNGSDREKAYARVDGAASAPVTLSYAVTAGDAARVSQWIVTVANFQEAGSAQGSIETGFSTQLMPCELKVASRGGVVTLSWRYTGEPFDGSFVVERFDRGGWQPVCTKDSDAASLSCQDNQARRGTVARYRVCGAISGSQCGNNQAWLTRSVRVR